MICDPAPLPVLAAWFAKDRQGGPVYEYEFLNVKDVKAR
jgi:hypothetical protein